LTYEKTDLILLPSRMARPVDAEQERIIAEYVAGLQGKRPSAADLAKKLDVTYNTAYVAYLRYHRRHESDSPPLQTRRQQRPISPKIERVIEETTRLQEVSEATTGRRLTLRELGEKFGMQPSNLSNALNYRTQSPSTRRRS